MSKTILLAVSWYPAAVAVIWAIGYLAMQMWRRRFRDFGFPVVTTSPGKDISWAIQEGYRKVSSVLPT